MLTASDECSRRALTESHSARQGIAGIGDRGRLEAGASTHGQSHFIGDAKPFRTSRRNMGVQCPTNSTATVRASRSWFPPATRRGTSRSCCPRSPPAPGGPRGHPGRRQLRRRHRRGRARECCPARRSSSRPARARATRWPAGSRPPPATSSLCSTPTARPTRPRSRASRGALAGRRLRQGHPVRRRRRQRRHHPAPARWATPAQRRRERALRHQLHRPVLRLQRVLARRARCPRPAAAPAPRPGALGRRLRDRDPDQHPGRRGRAARSARSQRRGAPHLGREQPARLPRRHRVLDHHARAFTRSAPPPHRPWTCPVPS